LKPVDPDLAQQLSDSLACSSFNCRWRWLPKSGEAADPVIECTRCGAGFKAEHVEWLRARTRLPG